MFALVRKEFRAFFSTLLGYVAVSMFLLLNGLFLWVFPGETNVFDAGQASLESFFIIAPWVLIIVVPAITMYVAPYRVSGRVVNTVITSA